MEHISRTLKNMRSAANMRAFRERKQSAEPSTTNPDEERARTLRNLQPLLNKGVTNAK